MSLWGLIYSQRKCYELEAEHFTRIKNKCSEREREREREAYWYSIFPFSRQQFANGFSNRGTKWWKTLSLPKPSRKKISWHHFWITILMWLIVNDQKKKKNCTFYVKVKQLLIIYHVKKLKIQQKLWLEYRGQKLNFSFIIYGQSMKSCYK